MGTKPVGINSPPGNNPQKHLFIDGRIYVLMAASIYRWPHRFINAAASIYRWPHLLIDGPASMNRWPHLFIDGRIYL